MNAFFSDSDIIASYTRADALADGEQINLSEKYPDECSLYKFPVFCTNKIWGLIQSAVENTEHCNDFKGVIWDVLYMSIHAPGRNSILGGTGTEFTVIITGGNVTPDFYEGGQPIYRLHSICGPMDIDNPAPAITIMFPNED